jgi:6-bladed beta-propeller
VRSITAAVQLFWCCALIAQDNGGEKQEAELRALAARSPRLALERTPLTVQPVGPGWELGMVSWVAVDPAGLIYLLQRGDKADPVVVVNREGHVLRSWGKGMYTMPHAIRIDPEGNVWTTDAASSMVIKFSPQGKKLMEIAVGGQPVPCPNNFCGTTDIAFAPNGRLFIADGYANARVLEYTASGKKIREWGKPGTGPGEFHLVHSIQVDEKGVVYVSDRENGRIQRFDLDGRYLGLWSNLGKAFSITLGPECLYIGTQPRNQPNGAPGWLMKIDRASGQVLGVVESTRNHGVAVTADGELLVGPGADGPQWFRKPR